MTYTTNRMELPPSVSRREAFTRPLRPQLCIIVPVYNESLTIKPFITAISPVIKSIEATTKILFVNDGSQDDTLDVALAACAENKNI